MTLEATASPSPQGEFDRDPPAPSLWAQLAVTVALGPGAGHAYAGHSKRAAFFAAPGSIASTFTAVWWLLWQPSLLAVSLATSLLLLAGAAFDLVRLSSSAEPNARAGARAKSFGAFALASFAGGALATALALALLVSVTKVKNRAMLPTLGYGNLVVLYQQGAANVGEVVVVAPEPGSTKLSTLRVVGLPGDTVEVRDAGLWVNGREVERCFVGVAPIGRKRKKLKLYVEKLGGLHLIATDTKPSRKPVGPFVVGEREIFLLGDYRSRAKDSRSFKTPIASQQLRGSAERFLTRARPGIFAVDELELPRGAEALKEEVRLCVGKLESPR